MFTSPGVASSKATKATLTRNEMVGWAMDRVKEKWRCPLIAAIPTPAAKDTSKAAGASQVQGRLWCRMADIVDADADVEIARLIGKEDGGLARKTQFGGRD
jgi:hypothetical protein